MPRLIDCMSLRQGKEKSLVFQTSQSKQKGFFRILNEKKLTSSSAGKEWTIEQLFCKKKKKCLTVAAPDGRERGSAYSVKEKVHDLSRQN